MSTGAGARDVESPLPTGMTFPRKRSVTRRFPEVELVEGEFQFITESRKPSTTSIIVPPIQLTEKDGILRDDYWNQIRTEWRVSEDSVDMSSKERSNLVAPNQPLPRASHELPAPCTAYLQTRFRDGPFEVLYPGSTDHYERREETRQGFHQRNLSDSTPLPHHGVSNGLPRVIEESERPKWYTTVEPKTLARSLFYFGFFFMPFWVINIIIMLVAIQPTPEWEESRRADGLSDRERTEYLKWVRATELKWCKRSLMALVACAIAWTVIIVIVKYSILPGVEY